MSENPKSFKCTVCQREHVFGLYVAAHATETLVHTCDCGARHNVKNYRVWPVKKLKARRQ